MTNDEIRKNVEARMSKFGFGHLDFFRHLTFVIWHFRPIWPL